MKNITIIFILILTLISMSGCATSMARSEEIGQRGIYPATFINCGMICLFCISGGPFLMEEINNVWVSPIFILGNTVDLPISIVSDTLFLPLDICCYLPPIEFNNRNKNQKKLKEHQPKEKQEKNKDEK
ncbi:MAG: YceK/YidQ family lipoprotein [Alphaproteobacteria bacterium]